MERLKRVQEKIDKTRRKKRTIPNSRPRGSSNFTPDSIEMQGVENHYDSLKHESSARKSQKADSEMNGHNGLHNGNGSKSIANGNGE
mmetsp:Transcript_20713/g.31759  ORF Transcript_20713/g.31759 Transcript_20713/m.31759 type:complete len:87 (-) Transcript_20713:5976-6236(-)